MKRPFRYYILLLLDVDGEGGGAFVRGTGFAGGEYTPFHADGNGPLAP